tara:strand:+ start:403 stop:825 length:423 start_codon:yes stop_codon:yes gene_type:complete
MNKTTWQLENEAQENAFARRLLVEYNIKEVTTQRQAKNGTRVFEFPVRARKHTHHSKSERLQLACFKSGYVRNQNSCSSNYQLNPQYKAKTRTMFLSNKGLHTVEYEGIMRTKIWNQLARLQFMLDFYLRNYKLNTITNG